MNNINKGHADGDVVMVDFDSESVFAKNGNALTTAGTYPLRRARYFSETGTPLLSSQQKLALTNLVNAVDPEMKHSMIVQNSRIVVSIAKRYTYRGLKLADLIRAGNQGLIHALETLEFEDGARYSSHITKCIGQSIEHALMQHNTLPNAARAHSVADTCFDDIIH